VRILVTVTPRSQTNEVTPDPGERVVRVRVTAPPADGKANEAVLALLRKRLGIRAGALRLVGGASSRRKWIEVDGITEAELWRRLIARS